jgi:hypothetical protein
MNTQTTTHASITMPAATLRAILATLNEYTTAERGPALTLARVTPIVIEQTADDETRPTGLTYEATDSYALVQITHRVEHDLPAPALIDPAAILATMPTKNETKKAGPSVLTLTGHAWQITTGHTTSTGTTPDAQWPTTPALWNDQRPQLAPYTLGAFQLARLAKIAKHLNTEQIHAATMATTNDQPDPRRPIVHTLNAGPIECRVLMMPQRRAGE